MNTNHTPGPWYQSERNGQYIVAKDIGDRSHDIAHPCWWSEETCANARLIAAAPDLLAALKNLVEAVEFTPLGVRGIKACQQARAAIAKARGEA